MTSRVSGLVVPARHQRSEADSGRESSDAVDHRGLLHDVGHGLTTVVLLMEAARDNAVQGSKERLLRMAEAETARLLATVHQGLRGEPSGSQEGVAVRAVLERIVELANCSRSTSVVMAAGVDVVASVDPVALWRIVGNLVDNAVQAAGPSGHVEVSLSETPGPGVLIEVVDDGPGFRGGPPPGAAGSGLDVVRRLLAASGGRLEIDDGGEGGSRVRVVLAVVSSVPEGGDDAARRSL